MHLLRKNLRRTLSVIFNSTTFLGMQYKLICILYTTTRGRTRLAWGQRLKLMNRTVSDHDDDGCHE